MEPSEDYSLLNEEINDGDVGVKNNSQPQDSANCKVYKRRWYVLFVLVLTSIVSNIMWNTWGPIQRPCRFVFGWERWAILLLSSFGAIGPILGAFPSTWLMDVKGNWAKFPHSPILRYACGSMCPLFRHQETTKTAHFPLSMTCMHNEVWG